MILSSLAIPIANRYATTPINDKGQTTPAKNIINKSRAVTLPEALYTQYTEQTVKIITIKEYVSSSAILKVSLFEYNT